MWHNFDMTSCSVQVFYFDIWPALIVNVCIYSRDKLSQFYPTRFAKRKKSFFNSDDPPEDRLAAWHRLASKKLHNVSMVEAYKMYLEYCWKLPYYG